jgi:hypothetical protein
MLSNNIVNFVDSSSSTFRATCNTTGEHMDRQTRANLNAPPLPHSMVEMGRGGGRMKRKT